MRNIYFHTAWRNISRNKASSSLNIAGLFTSLIAFMLMALYIEDELSFDRFNLQAENIYRVTDDKQTPDVIMRSATTAAPVAPALQQDFSQIKQAVRLINTEGLIKFNNKTFEERRIYFSDASIFSVFSFKMLVGDPAKALQNPSTLVITESSGKKYFGTENPVGKNLSVDGKNMLITGMIKDLPVNSHLQFDFLISMSTAQQQGSGYDWLFTNWYSNNFYTYLLLPENFNSKKLTNQFANFDIRHKEKGSTTVHHYNLEKLTDIYLHSDRAGQAGITGNINNLYIFSIVALSILLVACINFINLSTARSTERAKEVAVKKIIGANRKQMVRQFFTESFLMVSASMLLALFATALLLPAFNAFTGKSLSLNLFSLNHLSYFATLLLTISFLAGIYPAFVLSGFKPITALRGKVNASGWSIIVRKSLVIFQFTVSVILMVCSFIVYRQMQYMQEFDLGFAGKQTMIINFEGDNKVKQQLYHIKQELSQINGVRQITASSSVPGSENAGGWSMDFVKKNGDTIHTELPIYLTDFNFLHQYQIPVVAGRNFSEQYAEDTLTSMLINEAALKSLGFSTPGQALGVHVGMYPRDGIITGIVKDFHFKSLQTAVEPLAIRVLADNFRLLSVQIDKANLKQTITAIQNKWKNLVPERPLEFSFLDESFNKQYGAELKYQQVITLFTILAIAIACLGLFGLAMFSTKQRVKEIGIRKVLGASVADIVSIISKEFITLVLIAVVIASPLAWLAMNKWLQNFAYRTSINLGLFIFAGLVAIIVALATVSLQAIKAAIANPAKSLRAE